MLTRSSDIHQTNLFGQDLLLQLDPDDPLLQLASAIPWEKFDQDFAVHYACGIGALWICSPILSSATTETRTLQMPRTKGLRAMGNPLVPMP